MKKVAIGFMLLIAGATAANAQDFKKVRTSLMLATSLNNDQKLEEAKAEYDKLAADPKAEGKAEMYLLKAEILGNLAARESLATKYPTAAADALAALKKYLQLEPGADKLKEDNLAGVTQLYGALFNEGVKNYNAKNWDAAVNAFSSAIDMRSLMMTNKWITNNFDTTGYLYAGVSAQNAKKEDRAVKFYKAIVDNNVVGADNEPVYIYVTNYYLNQNDEAQFKKYFEAGKKNYPKSDFWDAAQFSFVTKGKAPADVVAIFDKEDQAGTISNENYSQFGAYFLQDSAVRKLPAAQKMDLYRKAEYAFDKVYRNDTSNILPLYNKAIAINAAFEQAYESATAIKGATPDIKAKRAQADKVADQLADNAVQVGEQVYSRFNSKTGRSKQEESSMKNTAKMLARTYEYKRERTKGKGTPADYDKYDKKLKFYDSKY